MNRPSASADRRTAAVKEIVALVTSSTGLVFSRARLPSLIAPIELAMSRAKCADLTAYARSLSESAELMDDLVAELTIGETYFFREPRQFDFLRREVLPVLAKRGAHSEGVRAWSAACATGEETYSLAILLYEERLADRAQILGTDISRPRLARANQGVYRPWSLRGVKPDVVARYFKRRKDDFMLIPDVRNPVEFRYLNLAEDTYPAISTGVWGMDIVLCRNVLIYFDSETIERVAVRLLATLSETGWLLLGATDPPLSDIAPCDVVRTEAGVAYRRAGVQRTSARHVVQSAEPQPVSTPSKPGSPAVQPYVAPAQAEKQDKAKRTETTRHTVVPPLLERSADQSVKVLPADRSDVVRAYEERDYERAVAIARSQIESNVEEAGTWAMLIRSLANLGRLTEAGESCATALDRFRLNAEIAYLHAILLIQAGQNAAAAAAAKRALYLERNMIVAHLALGTALSRAGDGAGARRAFENAAVLLARMEPESIVPCSDGEPAGRLLEMTRVHTRLTVRKTA
jgi:chemotaxis protein methyltransferase CheR